VKNFVVWAKEYFIKSKGVLKAGIKRRFEEMFRHTSFGEII
jgi:hypothetical protein